MLLLSALAVGAVLCAAASMMTPAPECKAKDLAQSIKPGMTSAEVDQVLGLSPDPSPRPWEPAEGNTSTTTHYPDDESVLVIKFKYRDGAERVESVKVQTPPGPVIRFLRSLGLWI